MDTSIGVKITQEEKDALLEYAKENDLSLSQVVRKACKEFLKNNIKQ